MGISSPSLLLTSISLSLSHFLFCFTAGEGRSRRAPPPHHHAATERFQIKWDLTGSSDLARSSEISPDLVSSCRIWWDLAGFWPDLAGSAAAPPSTSPVLSNIGVFADFLLLCFVDFLFFYFCCYGKFFVVVICWCLLLGWFSIWLLL